MSGSPWAWRDGERLFARVLGVRRVPAGTAVSYGYTWRAPRETTIALVGLGYADGLPRRASNRVEVGLAGHRVPVVGRIAMNVCTVDAGDLPVGVGDAVQVWGDGSDGLPTADEWGGVVGAPGAVLDDRVRLDDRMPTAGGGVRAVVDTAAITRNIATVAARVAPARLLIVVKAEALGHGIARTAEVAVAAGVEWLGVLDVPTGLELRAHPIVGAATRLLAWLHDPDETFVDAVAAELDLGVATLAQLDAVTAAARAAQKPARVHLNLDTGLTRDGAAVEQWPALLDAAAAAERDGSVEVVGLMSHVAEAGDDEDSAQRDRFAAAAELAERAVGHPLLRHLAASAISWTRPDMRFDLVRVGAHAVGIPVPDGTSAAELGLVPAMTVTAEVERIDDDGFAVVPVGVADGLPLETAGRAAVLAGGRLRPVRFALPHAMLLDGVGLSVGDEVVLFGTGARGEWTLRQWGDACGTIGEEIATQLRAPIAYVDSAAGVARTLVDTVTHDAEATASVAREFAPRLRAGDLIVLTGPLGAGKTTFMRALGEALQVRGPVTSPTFVISREHPSLVGGPMLVHVDAYRLGSAAELDDLDLDWAGSIVAVEWGRGKVPVTESWLEVRLDPGTGDDDRLITIEGHGPRWAA